jgi:hypothetical protein
MLAEHMALDMSVNNDRITYNLAIVTDIAQEYVQSDPNAHMRILYNFCRKMKDRLDDDLDELQIASQLLRQVAIFQYQTDTEVSLSEDLIQDRVEYLNTVRERFIDTTTQHELVIDNMTKARKNITNYSLLKKYDLEAAVDNLVYAKYFFDNAVQAYRQMNACIIPEDRNGIPAHVIQGYEIVHDREGECCICCESLADTHKKVVQVPCSFSHAFVSLF